MYIIPVSNGELIDKYTILLIKKIKINDESKLFYINKEINILNEYIKKLDDEFNIEKLISELKDINLKLWDIEDNIRIKEKNNCFDNIFIQLARSVYITNDKRSLIKKEINIVTKSNLREIKSYY